MTTTSSATGAPALEPTIIWCVPRSCSTAFERAFMQRADTITFHEPTGDAAYFSRERQNCRFSEAECAAEPERYARGLEQIVRDVADGKGKDTQGKRFIFIKDMAQYIMPADTLQALHPSSRVYHPSAKEHQPPDYRDRTAENTVPLPDFSAALPASFGRSIVRNPTALPTALLRRFRHTFLVRAPAKSVLSYWKAAREGAGGFEYFDGAEAGYKELALLHAWIANPDSDFHRPDGAEHALAQPMPPPLIDASVLLAQPEHVLEQYCGAIGVPFDASMLTWESSKGAGDKPAPSGSSNPAPGHPDAKGTNGSSANDLADFAKWGSYHKAAEESTGFRKEEDAKEKAAAKAKEAQPLPKEVQDTVDDNASAYDYLLANQTIQLP